MTLPQIQAVVFDFDGVILDSAKIKTEAFVEVYSDCPEHQAAIQAYHLANQGVSRFVKFRWIAENLLGKLATRTEIEELGSRFSRLVLQRVLASTHIPGSLEFLRFLRQNEIPAFVASGTPEEELRHIVEERDLTGFFQGVFGTPTSKTEIIRNIQSEHGFKSDSMLMLGDASTDYDAAAETGLHFVGVFSDEMKDYWAKQDADVVNDLTNIAERFDWETAA
ncbi:MAG: HAD hydrolase-like protein [Planctomycetota bacterium]|nr:HAD hydrolase-like protein [Planctomycetota bacterium]